VIGTLQGAVSGAVQSTPLCLPRLLRLVLPAGRTGRRSWWSLSTADDGDVARRRPRWRLLQLQRGWHGSSTPWLRLFRRTGKVDGWATVWTTFDARRSTNYANVYVATSTH